MIICTYIESIIILLWQNYHLYNHIFVLLYNYSDIVIIINIKNNNYINNVFFKFSNNSSIIIIPRVSIFILAGISIIAFLEKQIKCNVNYCDFIYIYIYILL